jgi:hypothetical protein
MMLNKTVTKFPYIAAILVTIYFIIVSFPCLFYLFYMFTPYGSVELLNGMFLELVQNFKILIIGYLLSLGILIFLKNNNVRLTGLSDH